MRTLKDIVKKVEKDKIVVLMRRDIRVDCAQEISKHVGGAIQVTYKKAKHASLLEVRSKNWPCEILLVDLARALLGEKHNLIIAVDPGEKNYGVAVEYGDVLVFAKTFRDSSRALSFVKEVGRLFHIDELRIGFATSLRVVIESFLQPVLCEGLVGEVYYVDESIARQVPKIVYSKLGFKLDKHSEDAVRMLLVPKKALKKRFQISEYSFGSILVDK